MTWIIFLIENMFFLRKSEKMVLWQPMNAKSDKLKNIFPMCFLSQLVTGFSLCHFSLWQCSCFDFLKAIWFQNNIWRELSLNLLFFLHCARIFVTVKQTQSQPNPNLFLVKISHFLFPPILSKLSTTAQSALLDLICCCLSCNIPSLLNLDYTIKLHSFAFQSLSPSSKHKQHTELWKWTTA